MPDQIDLSNQNLDCGCQFCGRRFDFNYGQAAQTGTVKCPACGETMEVGERLREIEQQVGRITGCGLKQPT